MFLHLSVILLTGRHGCPQGVYVWLLRGMRGCSGAGCAWLLLGGHAWLLLRGMRGCSGGWGMRGKGACMVKGGHAWWRVGHAWWGGCVAKGGMCGRGGVHGKGGGMPGKGGHVWQKGGWGACVVCTPPPRYGRSLRRRYSSYWNAFLLWMCCLLANSFNSICRRGRREN